jgi:hypothetical protein
MKCFSRLIVLLPLFVLVNTAGVLAVGQSAVITLVFPSGSRSMAMGEVGTALADDEQVLFYNPAGLGMNNSRWRGGAGTEFYEQLLPAFQIPDLWHFHWSGVYQPRYFDVGGFALDLNYINFGTNDLTDDRGRTIGRARSYEYVLGAAWGFNLEDLGIKNNAFGISLKYAYSALAPGIGTGDDGVGRTIAIDIGYLWQFLPFMRFGFTFMNMGPNIFYISHDQSDPIPFTINTAIAYKDAFHVQNITLFELAAELRTDIEVVKNYRDKSPDPFWKALNTGLINDTSMSMVEKYKEISWHPGFEATFFNTVSIRQGFLIDRAGQRYESHWGYGVKLFNHFQIDFSYIYSPEGYLRWMFREGSSGARDGQWQLTTTYFRIANWSEKDMTWWKK